MTPGQSAHAIELAEELARWAMTQLRHGPRTITAKADPADFVTDTDLRIEDHVRERIAAVFPRHGVTGEARPRRPGSPVWYTDPVDGTTNYASGLGWNSFALALADETGPLLGVVGDPYRNEIFAAQREEGARLNGRKIVCRPVDDMAGAVVLTEWMTNRPWPGAYDMIEYLAARHCTVRVMGSPALSLVSVAAGRAGAVVLGACQPVRTMAALLIATEAGCVVNEGVPPAGLTVAAPGLHALIPATLPGDAAQRTSSARLLMPCGDW